MTALSSSPSPALFRFVATIFAVATIGSFAATGAQARIFDLTYNGFFYSNTALNPAGAALQPFADATPFTMFAEFDNASPNLVGVHPGRPGFVAYTPTEITLQVLGRTYQVTPFDGTHPDGLSVAIFDKTSPFGRPGRDAVGFIQNPVADGAGIVGDFFGASPEYLVSHLTATTWTGFAGVGFSSGTCRLNCSPPGRPDAIHNVTPIPLTTSGVDYLLTLGSGDRDYVPGTTPNSATLTPEPWSLALLAVPLLALRIARRTHRVDRSWDPGA